MKDFLLIVFIVVGRIIVSRDWIESNAYEWISVVPSGMKYFDFVDNFVG